MIKTKVAVDLLQWIVIMGLSLHKCGATVRIVQKNALTDALQYVLLSNVIMCFHHELSPVFFICQRQTYKPSSVCIAHLA